LDALFGVGYELTPSKYLSQPGQFLCAERVDLATDKATIERVAIIGPVRAESQVELSRTDCFTLGLKNIPVLQSGQRRGTSIGDTMFVIRNGDSEVRLTECIIVAQRHIHLDTKAATKYKLRDGQIVSIKLDGERGGIFDNTVVRVSDDYAPAVHIDSDEANAMGFVSGNVEIVV